MTTQVARLETLLQEIETCEPKKRLQYFTPLQQGIEACLAAGETPPKSAHQCLSALEEDVIEARFDNMPI